VGVDFSAIAVWRARRKARRAGVTCRFHRVDVTELGFLEGPFDLVLDIGCLHSLPAARWAHYAAGVARLAQRGGLYMLYAFTLRPGGFGPGGVGLEDVHALFGESFALERREIGGDPTGPGSAWYWMRRRA
jgi:hypothetical protein